MTNWVTGESVLIQPQQYVSFPGTVGSYVSTPDSIGLQVANDIDIRVKVAPTSWISGAASQTYASKSSQGGLDNSWRFFENAGKLFFDMTSDGNAATARRAISTIVTGFDLATIHWVRVVADVNNGADGSSVFFYTSDDGVNWIQLGTTVTVSGVYSIYDSTKEIRLGTLSNNIEPLIGNLYYAEIRNGINGPIIAAFNPNKFSVGQTSKQMPTGETWTLQGVVSLVIPVAIAGTLTINEVSTITVATPNVSFMSTSSNADPYLLLNGNLPDFANTSATIANIPGDLDIRVRVAMDIWAPTTANNQMLISKWGAGGQRTWQFFVAPGGTIGYQSSETGNTSNSTLSKNSTIIVPAANGAVKWCRVVHDVDNGAGGNDVKFYTSDDNITWVQLGTTLTTANTWSRYTLSTEPIRVGTSSAVAGQLTGKIFYAEVHDGIDGTVIVKFNPRDGSNGATSFTSSTGELWNIMGTSALVGYGSVSDLSSLMYISLPGSANAVITTPDTSNNSLTSDLDLRAYAFINSAPSTETTLLSKYDPSSGQRAYALQVRPSGALRLLLSPNGNNFLIHDSTANTSFGINQYYRATADVNDGFGYRVIAFYTSADNINWTQLGATVRRTGAITIFDSNSAVVVGGLQFAPYTEAEMRISLDSVSNGVITYSRAGNATFTDHDGIIRTAITNEARFMGARRVQNIHTNSENVSSWDTISLATVTAGLTAPDGSNTAYRINGTAAAWSVHQSNTITGNGVYSCWVKSNVVGTQTFRFRSGANNTAIVANTTWQRFTDVITNITSVGLTRDSANLASDILIWHPQGEITSGAFVPNPSDYVSSGALSSPFYHGAGVDGVKYFDTYNGNVVQENKNIQSQTLDSGSWAKRNGHTVTADQTTAPDGSATADLVTVGAFSPGSRMGIFQDVAGSPITYTFSIYLKQNTGTNNVTIVLKNNATDTVVASSNCTITSAWQRFSVTGNVTANGFRTEFQGEQAGSFYAWGVQTQPGLFASTYVPTVAAAITNNLVENNAGSNIPDTILFGLMNEPIMPNMGAQSEDFSTSWTPTRTTVATNQIIAPDGNITADKLIEDNSVTNTHFLAQAVTIVSGNAYSWSVFAKTGTGSKRWLILNSNFSNSSFEQAYFDLGLGIVTGQAYGNTATMVSYPNGWYRCSVSGLGQASISAQFQFMLANVGNASFTYSGDNASSIYIWGNQIEPLIFPSSYFATTTPASRLSDVITMANTNINMDAAGGTIYFEYSAQPLGLGVGGRRAAFSLNGNGNNRLEFRGVNDLANTSSIAFGNGTVVIAVTSPVTLTNGVHSTAFTYGIGGVAMTVDGTAVTASGISSNISGTSITIGGSGASSLIGTMRRLRFWPQAITNTSLVAMTNNQVIPVADANTTTFNLAGKIFRAEVRNGINGPIVAVLEASRAANANTTSITSRTGEAWTVNRPASVFGFGHGTLLGSSTNATSTTFVASNVSGTFEVGQPVIGYTNSVSQNVYTMLTALNTIVVTANSSSQPSAGAAVTGLTSGKTANVNYVAAQME